MKYDIDVLKRVTYLIIGVGNLGTRVLDNLARLPHNKIILVDHDIVGEENVGYQDLYQPSDIGKGKVYAARDRIMEKYPWAKIEIYYRSIPDAIEDTGDELSSNILKGQFNFLDELIQRTDITLITLDAATARLSPWIVSIKRDKPFIDIGYQENFGNIFLWISGYPCPLCFIKSLKIKYDRTYYADPILVEIVTAIASKMAVDYVNKKVSESLKIEVYNYNTTVNKVAPQECKHYKEIKSIEINEYLEIMRKIYKEKFKQATTRYSKKPFS